MFMEPQLYRSKWYEIETNAGIEFIPLDLCSKHHIKDYIEGTKVYSVKVIKGYGARLSAPGYMDCTEWTVFDSKEEARQALKDMYVNDEYDNELEEAIDSL